MALCTICLSWCGLWTTDIFWELLRNVGLRLHLGQVDGNLHLDKVPLGTLQSAEHCQCFVVRHSIQAFKFDLHNPSRKIMSLLSLALDTWRNNGCNNFPTFTRGASNVVHETSPCLACTRPLSTISRITHTQTHTHTKDMQAKSNRFKSKSLTHDNPKYLPLLS